MFKKDTKFSPPYGDGTDAEDKANAEEMFSPPYEENPLSHGLRRASSPERGSFSLSGGKQSKTSPFRGRWHRAAMTERVCSLPEGAGKAVRL